MTARTVGKPEPALPARPVAWLLLLLVASQLLFLYSDVASAGLASEVLMLALPVLGWRALRLREGYLLVLCFLLVCGALLLEKPVIAMIDESLERSAYLASFILLMALLREGAVGSRSVLEVGTFLTQQPASRRFLTLFGGGHFFAVLINLGALSLLAPIIQRGVRAAVPDGQELDDIGEVRERRQLSAALRGFSWFLVWAPTAVTQAVMPTLMSGIDIARLIATGLGMAAVMLLVSWAEDSLRWRNYRKMLIAQGRLPLPSATRIPGLATISLGIVCAALAGLSITFMTAAQVTIVTGVMLAAPIVVVVWIFAQQSPHAGRAASTVARLGEISFRSVPGYFREAIFIACAGFIGTMGAMLVPAGQLAEALELTGQPDWIILWVLTFSVWAFGQVGLSPITMAVFLGSLVAELPVLPVDITLAALAIAAGTAVCTTGAPFSSGALMLSRATGHSSVTLTWRWNGAYTGAALLVLAAIYGVLTAW